MEIEDRDDAEDAIKDINGKAFNGGRIKVEFSYAYSGSDRDRRSGRGFDRDKGGRFDTSNDKILLKLYVAYKGNI